MDIQKRTWAEIDLGRIAHNYNEIKKKAPAGCKVAVLCKANAYGHGAVPVARYMQEIGADMLLVSCFDEALELRENGVTLPILLLAPSPASLAPDLAKINAVQSVGDLECAAAMSRALDGTGLTLGVHIKLETGMGRTGINVSEETAIDDILSILNLPNLDVQGVFTHFAVSDSFGDPFTFEQYNRFTSAIEKAEKLSGRSLGIKHCANSGAVINYSEMYLDMVRPGLLLYGLYPAKEKGGLDLKPAMSVYTHIYQITNHHAGDTISYGRTFTCEKDMRIAVVPIGYADGLYRSLSGKIEMMLHGKRVKQIGRICMDMCMLDISDIPDAKVGDIVTLFGDDPSVNELAEKAGTISYEITCSMSPRIHRTYSINGVRV